MSYQPARFSVQNSSMEFLIISSSQSLRMPEAVTVPFAEQLSRLPVKLPPTISPPHSATSH